MGAGNHVTQHRARWAPAACPARGTVQRRVRGASAPWSPQHRARRRDRGRAQPQLLGGSGGVRGEAGLQGCGLGSRQATAAGCMPRAEDRGGVRGGREEHSSSERREAGEAGDSPPGKAGGRRLAQGHPVRQGQWASYPGPLGPTLRRPLTTALQRPGKGRASRTHCLRAVHTRVRCREPRAAHPGTTVKGSASYCPKTPPGPRAYGPPVRKQLLARPLGPDAQTTS